jgi:hypothetical protein
MLRACPEPCAEFIEVVPKGTKHHAGFEKCWHFQVPSPDIHRDQDDKLGLNC